MSVKPGKTAVPAKAPPAKPMTAQDRFDNLWGDECRVNVYQKTHLEVSSGGYVKYEFHGCDTTAKLLDGMRATLKGVIRSLKERRDELNDALETIDDALEV